jgi:lysophospholipid acyltransferase (LPLAT)-like uncharacterized protein
MTFLKAFLIAGLYAFFSALWRIRELGRADLRAQGEAKIYAHWHGDELLMMKMGQFRNMAVMASRSKDGELMKWVLTLLGFKVVRGSSSKGGAGGLKGLLDAVMKKGCHTSLAVDGPRGPIYEVKPGILAIAQKTGKPIVPTVGAAQRRFLFKKAWNQCYLPLPFSKCVVIYGDPISVSENANEEELEKLRSVLKTNLIELKAKAEEMCDRKFLPAKVNSLHGA